jgi:hypothetical protein
MRLNFVDARGLVHSIDVTLMRDEAATLEVRITLLSRVARGIVGSTGWRFSGCGHRLTSYTPSDLMYSKIAAQIDS